MSKKQWLVTTIAGIFLVLAIIYCYKAVQFQHKFLNNTTIGGTDVSHLTQQEAVEKISKKANDDNYHVLLDGKPFKDLKKKDTGVNFDIKKTVTNGLTSQNPWLWFMSYLTPHEDEALVRKDIDSEKLNSTLTSLTTAVDTLNKDRTPTKNASVQLVDGKFQIIPEAQGDSIDTATFIEAAKNSISSGDSTIDLSDYVAKPTILSTDSKLSDELNKINKIAAMNASYTINGKEAPIPKETIASWVVYKDGEITLDESKVKSYVENLGTTYNTSTNPSTFKSTKRGDVSVPAGTLSWTIATNTETQELTDAILKGEDFSGRVPAYQGSASPESDLIGNTYIEVDLANQHMWYYKDGVNVLDTDVITGKPSTPTPTGVFYVWNKERNATLVGEDYKTPVDYWMPIDWDGVGIHDSPWQNDGAYGGDSHLTVGSHGCVNTPPSVCAQLFDMVGVGVPVVVF